MTGQLRMARAARLLAPFLALALVAGTGEVHTASRVDADDPGVHTDVDVLPAPETKRYEVMADASDIWIFVMRGGPLARLGHNHIVGGPVVRGQVWLTDKLSTSGFRIFVDVADLEVDRPTWRREAGAAFSKQPGAKDIEGTRENMLGPAVLDAEHYPIIKLDSVEVSGQGPELTAVTRFTVRDQTHTIPVNLRLDHDDPFLKAEGEFKLLQSDFGITPFSALLGSIRVQDELRVVFRIVAKAQE